MKFHSTKAMQGEKKRINLSYFFFSKAWQETRGNIFATGNVCLLKNIPTFESSSGVLILFYFQSREGITLTPTGKRKMPHCNSPPGNRNKGITYACIMQNFLTQTRQKTSLFFTRHLKSCASQLQKPRRQANILY